MKHDDLEALRLQEAGDWVVRFATEDLPPEEITAWLAWCEADPGNLAAFELLQRRWQTLDALKSRPALAAARRPRRRLLRWGLAASVAVLAAAMAYLDRGAWIPPPPAQVTRATISKTATLADGSSVVLSQRTMVAVDFSGPRRELKLSRGEAYFKVHHDQAHPFVVRAGEVSVTAVGTAFDVRREEDRVVVTVEEGVVEVADGGTRWRTEAGYQLAYSAGTRAATLASIDPATVLKWRTGQLAYLAEPLGAVVEDIDRYSPRKIMIMDRSIAELKFTGNVIPASIDDWLTAIQDLYPVRAVELPSGDIALVAAAPRSDAARN